VVNATGLEHALSRRVLLQAGKWAAVWEESPDKALIAVRRSEIRSGGIYKSRHMCRTPSSVTGCGIGNRPAKDAQALHRACEVIGTLMPQTHLIFENARFLKAYLRTKGRSTACSVLTRR
jgi:hypothetical protein